LSAVADRSFVDSHQQSIGFPSRPLQIADVTDIAERSKHPFFANDRPEILLGTSRDGVDEVFF
jgi:hypothetical protein